MYSVEKIIHSRLCCFTWIMHQSGSELSDLPEDSKDHDVTPYNKDSHRGSFSSISSSTSINPSDSSVRQSNFSTGSCHSDVIHPLSSFTGIKHGTLNKSEPTISSKTHKSRKSKKSHQKKSKRGIDSGSKSSEASTDIGTVNVHVGPVVDASKELVNSEFDLKNNRSDNSEYAVVLQLDHAKESTNRELNTPDNTEYFLDDTTSGPLNQLQGSNSCLESVKTNGSKKLLDNISIVESIESTVQEDQNLQTDSRNTDINFGTDRENLDNSGKNYKLPVTQLQNIVDSAENIVPENCCKAQSDLGNTSPSSGTVSDKDITPVHSDNESNIKKDTAHEKTSILSANVSNNSSSATEDIIEKNTMYTAREPLHHRDQNRRLAPSSHYYVSHDSRGFPDARTSDKYIGMHGPKAKIPRSREQPFNSQNSRLIYGDHGYPYSNNEDGRYPYSNIHVGRSEVHDFNPHATHYHQRVPNINIQNHERNEEQYSKSTNLNPYYAPVNEDENSQSEDNYTDYSMDSDGNENQVHQSRSRTRQSRGVYRHSPERRRLHVAHPDLASSYENIYDHADLSVKRDDMRRVSYEEIPSGGGFDADRYFTYLQKEDDVIGDQGNDNVATGVKDTGNKTGSGPEDDDLLGNYVHERELFELKQNYAKEKELFQQQSPDVSFDGNPSQSMPSSTIYPLSGQSHLRHLRDVSPPYSDGDSELLQYYNYQQEPRQDAESRHEPTNTQLPAQTHVPQSSNFAKNKVSEHIQPEHGAQQNVQPKVSHVQNQPDEPRSIENRQKHNHSSPNDLSVLHSTGYQRPRYDIDNVEGRHTKKIPEVRNYNLDANRMGHPVAVPAEVNSSLSPRRFQLQHDVPSNQPKYADAWQPDIYTCTSDSQQYINSAKPQYAQALTKINRKYSVDYEELWATQAKSKGYDKSDTFLDAIHIPRKNAGSSDRSNIQPVDPVQDRYYARMAVAGNDDFSQKPGYHQPYVPASQSQTAYQSYPAEGQPRTHELYKRGRHDKEPLPKHQFHDQSAHHPRLQEENRYFYAPSNKQEWTHSLPASYRQQIKPAKEDRIIVPKSVRATEQSPTSTDASVSCRYDKAQDHEKPKEWTHSLPSTYKQSEAKQSSNVSDGKQEYQNSLTYSSEEKPGKISSSHRVRDEPAMMSDARNSQGATGIVKSDPSIVAYHGHKGLVVQVQSPPKTQSTVETRPGRKKPLLSRKQLWQQSILDRLPESCVDDVSPVFIAESKVTPSRNEDIRALNESEEVQSPSTEETTIDTTTGKPGDSWIKERSNSPEKSNNVTCIVDHSADRPSSKKNPTIGKVDVSWIKEMSKSPVDSKDAGRADGKTVDTSISEAHHQIARLASPEKSDLSSGKSTPELEKQSFDRKKQIWEHDCEKEVFPENSLRAKSMKPPSSKKKDEIPQILASRKCFWEQTSKDEESFDDSEATRQTKKLFPYADFRHKSEEPPKSIADRKQLWENAGRSKSLDNTSSECVAVERSERFNKDFVPIPSKRKMWENPEEILQSESSFVSHKSPISNKEQLTVLKSSADKEEEMYKKEVSGMTSKLNAKNYGYDTKPDELNFIEKYKWSLPETKPLFDPKLAPKRTSDKVSSSNSTASLSDFDDEDSTTLDKHSLPTDFVRFADKFDTWKESRSDSFTSDSTSNYNIVPNNVSDKNQPWWSTTIYDDKELKTLDAKIKPPKLKDDKDKIPKGKVGSLSAKFIQPAEEETLKVLPTESSKLESHPRASDNVAPKNTVYSDCGKQQLNSLKPPVSEKLRRSPVNLEESGMAALLGINIPKVDPGIEEELIQPVSQERQKQPLVLNGEEFRPIPKARKPRGASEEKVASENSWKRKGSASSLSSTSDSEVNETQGNKSPCTPVEEDMIEIIKKPKAETMRYSPLRNLTLQAKDCEDDSKLRVDLAQIKHSLLTKSDSAESSPSKNTKCEPSVDLDKIKKDLFDSQETDSTHMLDDMPISEHDKKVAKIKEDIFNKTENNIDQFMPARYATLERCSDASSTDNGDIFYVLKQTPTKRRSNVKDELTELEDLYNSLDLENEMILEGAARRDYPARRYRCKPMDDTGLSVSNLIALENGKDDDYTRKWLSVNVRISGNNDEVVSNSPSSPYSDYTDKRINSSFREGSFDSLSSEIRRARGKSPLARRAAFPDKVYDDMALRTRQRSSSSGPRNPKNLLSPETFLSKSPALSPSVSSDSLNKRTHSKLKEADATWDDLHFRQVRRSLSSPNVKQSTSASPMVTSPTTAEYLKDRQLTKYQRLMRLRPEKNADKMLDDLAYRQLRKDISPFKPEIPASVYKRLSAGHRPTKSDMYDRLRRAKSEPRKNVTNSPDDDHPAVERGEKIVKVENQAHQLPPLQKPQSSIPKKLPHPSAPRRNVAKGVGIMIELYNSTNKSKSLPDLNDESLFSVHLNVYGDVVARQHEHNQSARPSSPQKSKTPRAVKQSHEMRREMRQVKASDYPNFEEFETVKQIPAARVAPMQQNRYDDQLFPDSADELEENNFRKTDYQQPQFSQHDYANVWENYPNECHGVSNFRQASYGVGQVQARMAHTYDSAPDLNSNEKMISMDGTAAKGYGV